MSAGILQYQKIKSISKVMLSRGKKLNQLVAETLKICADIVGSSLGPGGRPVVIERQETQMAPIITKDGVTIFRNLGFDDPTAQVLMEAARDAAIKTASDAGDGTSSATILAEAFVRYTQEFCSFNPHASPQRVVSFLQKMYDNEIAPKIEREAIKPSMNTEEGRRLLHGVAKISANGDLKLADAVMECFDLVGDEGNVSILEESGRSGYVVEKIDGYPLLVGFEDCCGPFYNEFINDHATQSCRLQNPVFICFYGEVSEVPSLEILFNKLGNYMAQGKLKTNVVLCATRFSEDVLSQLAVNFKNSNMKIFPLRAPMTGTANSQFEFLRDVSALTGATVADPMNLPLVDLDIEHLGTGPTMFESGRFRTNIIGYNDELRVMERVVELQGQIDSAAISEYDKGWLKERIAKLSSGIARLIVRGATLGETKEKRDRAEDAICAVRGALKYGALYGGGSFLKRLYNLFTAHQATSTLEVEVANNVMAKALKVPVMTLYKNAGYSEDEAEVIFSKLNEPYNELPGAFNQVFDVASGEYVDPLKQGILDSVPAVRDAIRNSLSIATLLGTCGGTVCFKRDNTLENMEARSALEFEKDLPPAASPY
jgi:chaperonin GroEL